MSLGQMRCTLTNTMAVDGRVSFRGTEGNLRLKDVLLHKSIAGAIDAAHASMRPNARPQGSPDIDTFVDFVATFSQVPLSSAALCAEMVFRTPRCSSSFLDGLERGAGSALTIDRDAARHQCGATSGSPQICAFLQASNGADF